MLSKHWVYMLTVPACNLIHLCCWLQILRCVLWVFYLFFKKQLESDCCILAEKKQSGLICALVIVEYLKTGLGATLVFSCYSHVFLSRTRKIQIRSQALETGLKFAPKRHQLLELKCVVSIAGSDWHKRASVWSTWCSKISDEGRTLKF